MTIGIYILSFDNYNHVYIGQSTCIENRTKKHIYMLRKGIHYNSRLTKAFLIYGDPIIEILEECNVTDLTSIEDTWIDEFDSFNSGLNMRTSEFTASTGCNHPQSKFTKEQLVAAMFLILEDYMTYEQVANEIGMTRGSVSMLAGGKVHGWLNEEYPEEFTQMLRMVGNRDTNHWKHLNKYPSILSPSGTVYSNITNLKQFAKEHDLHYATLHKVVRGMYGSVSIKGWTVYHEQ